MAAEPRSPGYRSPPSLGETIRVLRWRGRFDEESFSRVMAAFSEARELERLGLLEYARASYNELFAAGFPAHSDPVKAVAAAGMASVEARDASPRDALKWLEQALMWAEFVAYDEPAFRLWLFELRLEQARTLARVHPPTALARLAELAGGSPPDPLVQAELHQARGVAQLNLFDHKSAAHSADAAIGLLEAHGPSDMLRAAFELRSAAMAHRNPAAAEYAYIRAAEVALEIARREVAADPAYTRSAASFDPEPIWQRLAHAKDAMDRYALGEAAGELTAVREDALRQQDQRLLAAADYHLGGLYLYTGSGSRAVEHAVRARALAAAAGWAWLEGAAILLQHRIFLSVRVEADESRLASLSRVRWLDPMRSPGEQSLLADGWLHRFDANLAAGSDAWDLAEAGLRRAVNQVNGGRMPLIASHAIALIQFLRDRGEAVEAANLEEQLTSQLASFRGSTEAAKPDPLQQDIVVASNMVEEALVAPRLLASPRTTGTLDALVSLCDRYETRLREAGEVTDTAELRTTLISPYAQAAELALELGDLDRGFTLLERGRDRGLMRAVAPEYAVPQHHLSLRECQQKLAPARRLVLFVIGQRALWCLSVTRDSADAALVCRTDDPPWQEFKDAVGLAQSAAHLRHPVMHQINEAIGAGGSGAAVTTIVPYGFLHNTPLHAVTETGSSHGAYVYAASASMAVRAGSALTPAGRAVVMGDPEGDLPWARQECQLVARAYGVSAHTGPEATLDVLDRELSAPAGPLRLVHMACHARFDPARPGRSGVHLAGGRLTDPFSQPWRRVDDDMKVVALTDLGRLRWQGALVVVNACDAGRMQVARGDELRGMTSTLLAAGAGAVLTSLWQVEDPAGALIVTAMMQDLAAQETWSTPAVAAALASAQARYRQSAGNSELPALCRELGFEPGSAITQPGIDADDPWMWAPFVLVGGSQL